MKNGLVGELTDEVQTLRSRSAEAERIVEDLRNEVASITEDRDELSSALAAAEVEADCAKDELESQCAELVKELDHQKALVDEAGAKFTALSTEKEAAEAAHEEMKLVTGQEKEALEAKVGVGACS